MVFQFPIQFDLCPVSKLKQQDANGDLTDPMSIQVTSVPGFCDISSTSTACTGITLTKKIGFLYWQSGLEHRSALRYIDEWLIWWIVLLVFWKLFKACNMSRGHLSLLSPCYLPLNARTRTHPGPSSSTFSKSGSSSALSSLCIYLSSDVILRHVSQQILMATSPSQYLGLQLKVCKYDNNITIISKKMMSWRQRHPKTSTNDNSKNGYIEFAHQAKELLVATLLHLGSEVNNQGPLNRPLRGKM